MYSERGKERKEGKINIQQKISEEFHVGSEEENKKCLTVQIIANNHNSELNPDE